MQIIGLPRRVGLAALLILLVGAAPPPPPAVIGAAVTIAPTRLVFGQAPQRADVALSTTEPATDFAVSLVDRTMAADGRILEDAPGGAERRDSAKPMVEVVPARLRLGAGNPQTIHVRFRGGGGRANGEYRTHLTLTPATPETPLAPGASRMLLSYSIPIIVRLGPVNVRAGLGNIRGLRLSEVAGAAQSGLPTDQTALSFDLQRLGANSIYGDVEVYSTKTRPEILLAVLHGVGVYPEVASRPIVLPLSRPLDSGERVRVDFVDRDLHPGRVLASADFTQATQARYAAMSASSRARRVNTIARS